MLAICCISYWAHHNQSMVTSVVQKRPVAPTTPELQRRDLPPIQELCDEHNRIAEARASFVPEPIIVPRQPSTELSFSKAAQKIFFGNAKSNAIVDPSPQHFTEFDPAQKVREELLAELLREKSLAAACEAAHNIPQQKNFSAARERAAEYATSSEGDLQTLCKDLNPVRLLQELAGRAGRTIDVARMSVPELKTVVAELCSAAEGGSLEFTVQTSRTIYIATIIDDSVSYTLVHGDRHFWVWNAVPPEKVSALVRWVGEEIAREKGDPTLRITGVGA